MDTEPLAQSLARGEGASQRVTAFISGGFAILS